MADNGTAAAETDAPTSALIRELLSFKELRPCDEEACRVFFGRLDVCDIRMRFASLHFSMRLFLPSPRGIAFAALDAAEEIVGVANLVHLDRHIAEIALIVRSDRQRRGIGRQLLAQALRWAGDQGFSHLLGYVLRENQRMRALARTMGFRSVGTDGLLIEMRCPISRTTGKERG